MHLENASEICINYYLLIYYLKAYHDSISM